MKKLQGQRSHLLVQVGDDLRWKFCHEGCPPSSFGGFGAIEAYGMLRLVNAWSCTTSRSSIRPLHLEKEATVKGTPLGQAHGIDIPPPRPKRKPNCPYPRKTATCVLPAMEAADEKISKGNAPLEVSTATNSLQGTKETSDSSNCSIVLNLFQDAPSASFSSHDRGTHNAISLRKIIPTSKETKEAPSIKGSLQSIEVNVNSSINDMSISDHTSGGRNAIGINLNPLQANFAVSEEQSEVNILQGDQNSRGCAVKNVRTTCFDGSKPKPPHENGSLPSSASSFMNHTMPTAPGYHNSPAMSSVSQPFPAFSFAQFPNGQDFYKSFNFSSTFSTLLISTLLQNPSVYAAACMAASLWPSGELSSSIDSSSMAAIAAATVAAASAWWATHGLLPFFPTIHAAGFTATTAIPVVNRGQTQHDEMEDKQKSCQNFSITDQGAVCSERLKTIKSQTSPLSCVLMPSDSDETEKDASNVETLSGTFAYHTSEKAKNAERSSCGSNTPSSSEVDTDAARKNDETKDEAKQEHLQNFITGEANPRRTRSTSSINETWKEVSQEGRLAFQALFTRDVLPQTFSPKHAEVETVLKKAMQTAREEACKNVAIPSEFDPGNPKVHRTGFKPYKRCSAEVEKDVNLTRIVTGNKRIRVEGEASS
ncbi:hypothetical protein HPP92_028476 [Vanilla planifolia]|uniref:Uncharacterized protein n=1 Tax=Vanilla planifolia TaxID=51239 RepID=A0A835P5I6_VANPL|nr:hypothetical protein HPP92_028476 [Vanilla planifolia]